MSESFEEWWQGLVFKIQWAPSKPLAEKVWNHQQKKITELEGDRDRLWKNLEDLSKSSTERVNGLAKEKEELTQCVADMREFVEDCAVSHHETRYKYRAQVILNKLERGKE